LLVVTAKLKLKIKQKQKQNKKQPKYPKNTEIIGTAMQAQQRKSLACRTNKIYFTAPLYY
jgi:hypothetical protein